MRKITYCLLILLLSSSVIHADSNVPNDEEERNARAINSAIMPSPDLVNEVEKYKKEIEANQDTINSIKSLAADPQIQEIANDPKIMKAVQSGDFQTLMASEKFMSLLDNPKMQEINKKVTEKKK